ncbi:MAG: RluA family pseudouridine synthase [Leucothrix sp.]
MPDPKEFHIPITADTVAVDCLADASGLSKQKLKQAMQKGCVWLEQHSTRGDDKQFIQRLRRAKRILKAGETLHCYYDEAVLQEEPIAATLISDEGDYSIWNKPSGMRSQGSKWGDHCTLYRWAEQHLRPERPAFIVHRLDRAASGLMLLAHKKQVTTQFTTLFAKRQIEKRYQVKVEGDFSALIAGEASHSIRSNIDRKAATSHVRHLSYDQAHDESLLEVQIETGRKHQIRVHLASVGFPVVGDRLHGSGKNTKDLQLAAVSLTFQCPVSGEAKSFALNPTFAV